jgi:outer membrane protein insertion porin family/translocation and assembly module TamA
LLALACVRAPQHRFNLETLDVTGNDHLEDEEIEEKIASRETPRFLGLISGLIYDHEIFNRFVLERDLQRIERLYRSKGFYKARARAARVQRFGTSVRVEIIVEEGAPVLVRRVDVHGLDPLPADVRVEAYATVTSRMAVGSYFDEEVFSETASALASSLADQGYALANVRKDASVSLPDDRASVGFWVNAGSAVELGAVKIEGLGNLPEEEVRRALALSVGDPYSQTDLDEGKRALLDLGVFSSVTIKPQIASSTPGPGGKPRVPILVTVERSKMRSVRVGGGIQIDSIKSDVHLTAGWEDQNFLGGMRKLLLEVVPGAVLHPTRFPSLEAPERLLPQGRAHSEFRQPGFLEGRTSGIVKGQLRIAPSLLGSVSDPNAPILGYRDYLISAGLERSYRRLFGSITHTVQINVPFAYAGEKHQALEPVLVSYPAVLATLDLRDDRVKPRKGLYASTEVQVAGVFGDARDVKLRPELRAYVPLTRRTTLAARGAIGLLFPQNYGTTVLSNATSGDSGLDGTSEEVSSAWVRDTQLMFFRGFFAGGTGSNRGYAPREIGPHGTIPYYIPGQAAENLDASCIPGSDAAASEIGCDLPLGGFTLWEASLELRRSLIGALSGALFADAADVSPRQWSFRWRPHLSVGAGLRYDTPVGPVRFDAGYRLPHLQAPEGATDEGQPGKLFGLPMAFSFGIGEAF